MRIIKILATAILTACVAPIFGQSGTNSPYSQYGLGIMSDQTSGFNRGMNGLGLGFHEHNQINFINPASYSELDSLTFIFDAGASAQITNLREGKRRLNAKNADFEYVVAGFRAFKNLGVSFGIVPFTNVGYNYSNTQNINDYRSTTYTNTYSGEGGIHQIYLGAGWKPLKGLSIGANLAYIWGGYDRTITNSYSEETVNTISKKYSLDVYNYKIDFGLQYTAKIVKGNWLTIGATYGLGHSLNADPKCEVISTNSSTNVSDTTTYTINKALKLPSMFAVGLMWNYHNKLKVGVDYSLQKWASVDFPRYTEVNGTPQYVLVKNQFKDRNKITIGGDLCPEEGGRGFFKRMHYRMGLSYATPYLKINGVDGPKEYSVSAGVGMPIINGYNNRSQLNVSVQYVRMAQHAMITENTFRINIGLTFNEKWFAKWKVE